MLMLNTIRVTNIERHFLLIYGNWLSFLIYDDKNGPLSAANFCRYSVCSVKQVWLENEETR